MTTYTATKDICQIYAALVYSPARRRDKRIAEAWKAFDRTMTQAARDAHVHGDWRDHERAWTKAQADRADLTGAAWRDYREATALTNEWFRARLRKAAIEGETDENRNLDY